MVCKIQGVINLLWPEISSKEKIEPLVSMHNHHCFTC